MPAGSAPSGCSAPPPPATIELSGSVTFGRAVSGATVCAFGLDSGEVGGSIPLGLAAGSTGALDDQCYVTGADGLIEATVDAATSGDLYLTATGGTAHDGDSGDVPFTDDGDQPLVMRTITTVDDGSIDTATIDPISEDAVRTLDGDDVYAHLVALWPAYRIGTDPSDDFDSMVAGTGLDGVDLGGQLEADHSYFETLVTTLIAPNAAPRLLLQGGTASGLLDPIEAGSARSATLEYDDSAAAPGELVTIDLELTGDDTTNVAFDTGAIEAVTGDLAYSACDPATVIGTSFTWTCTADAVDAALGAVALTSTSSAEGTDTFTLTAMNAGHAFFGGWTDDAAPRSTQISGTVEFTQS